MLLLYLNAVIYLNTGFLHSDFRRDQNEITVGM